MKNLIYISLMMMVAVIAVRSQDAKMASVYTDLKNDCRPETKTSDEVPFICKAVGGYRVRIIPAGAWAETIEIVDAKKETVASLGIHGYAYSLKGKRMLEWRMANGKPFAVIFRIDKFDSKDALESGDNPYLDKYKIGEALIVRGLPGYSQINFEVGAKEKNANAKAQNLADSNFQ